MSLRMVSSSKVKGHYNSRSYCRRITKFKLTSATMQMHPTGHAVMMRGEWEFSGARPSGEPVCPSLLPSEGGFTHDLCSMHGRAGEGVAGTEQLTNSFKLTHLRSELRESNLRNCAHALSSKSPDS